MNDPANPVCRLDEGEGVISFVTASMITPLAAADAAIESVISLGPQRARLSRLCAAARDRRVSRTALDAAPGPLDDAIAAIAMAFVDVARVERRRTARFRSRSPRSSIWLGARPSCRCHA